MQSTALPQNEFEEWVWQGKFYPVIIGEHPVMCFISSRGLVVIKLNVNFLSSMLRILFRSLTYIKKKSEHSLYVVCKSLQHMQ